MHYHRGTQHALALLGLSKHASYHDPREGLAIGDLIAASSPFYAAPFVGALRGGTSGNADIGAVAGTGGTILGGVAGRNAGGVAGSAAGLAAGMLAKRLGRPELAPVLEARLHSMGQRSGGFLGGAYGNNLATRGLVEDIPDVGTRLRQLVSGDSEA